MRGADLQQLGMFSYVSLEERVPADHPIRKLRLLVDVILGELDGVFAERYAARWTAHRFRRSACCEPRCCRWSTACAASGC